MKTIRLAAVLSACAFLSACGESPDAEKMKAGLQKSGMEAAPAACFADKWAESAKGEIYNYVAALMAEGASEKDAVNRARRKYGADFKTDMEEARESCVPKDVAGKK